jgi:hypothetical protein
MPLEIVKKPRQVYLETDKGQKQMPPDYQLSKAEVEKGSFDSIPIIIKDNSGNILCVDLTPSHDEYSSSWVTGTKTEDVLKVIRDSYLRLKGGFIPPREPVEITYEKRKEVYCIGSKCYVKDSKPEVEWAPVMLFGGERIGLPMGSFLDPRFFDRKVRNKNIGYLRINTEYCGYGFDTESTSSKKRVFGMITEYALPDEIAKIFSKTSEMGVLKEDLDSLQHTLFGLLDNFKKLTKK